MHFRHTKTHNDKYNKLRWGIASSDIPVPSAPDPASSRVCLILVEENIIDESAFIRDKAAYLDLDQLELERHGAVIRRLIDNTMTALSNPRSIVPAKRNDFNERIQDYVLKVNQSTIENASDAMFDLSDDE